MSDRNPDERRPRNMESASDRAHGTHGRGDERESRLDPAATEAGNAGDPASASRARKAADAEHGKLSDPAWGSGAAGGSVADKRPPESKPSTSRAPHDREGSEG
jgi:hypothetical protein